MQGSAINAAKILRGQINPLISQENWPINVD
jgi:hypothetical protein